MDNRIEKKKNLVKEAILEALYEYEQFKRKKRRNQDTDLISTSEAYRLRGRARVTQLILLGMLKQTSSGVAPNSVKYVSKKKLFDLDKVTL